MADARPQLPELAVNRSFMSAFLAEAPPCLALGMVEEGASRYALLALHLDQVLPRQVAAGGFSFGHALVGGGTWELAHFGFAFYGFAAYNVLINPSDPVAQTVLKAMVTSGAYFFFALDGDRRTTAFRSSIGKDNLAGLKANMHRIPGSATTDAQYRQAVAQLVIYFALLFPSTLLAQAYERRLAKRPK